VIKIDKSNKIYEIIRITSGLFLITLSGFLLGVYVYDKNNIWKNRARNAVLTYEINRGAISKYKQFVKEKEDLYANKVPNKEVIKEIYPNVKDLKFEIDFVHKPKVDEVKIVGINPYTKETLVMENVKFYPNQKVQEEMYFKLYDLGKCDNSNAENKVCFNGNCYCSKPEYYFYKNNGKNTVLKKIDKDIFERVKGTF